MVPTADSRGPGREQRSGEPVDEASARRRNSGSKAPTRSWSPTAPERGAARQGARASASGSRGSRFSGRSMDVRESGYRDPKGVWGELSPGSCESFAQSLGAEPAEAAAPGKSEGPRGRRALERREVAFPQKRALKEGRTIVFCDQSYRIRLYTSRHEREDRFGELGILAVGSSVPEG